MIKEALPEDFSKRRGRFSIPHDLIHDTPNALLKVMSECLIVRAESMWAEDIIEYTALSRYFEPANLGEQIPEYTWIVDQDDEGVVTGVTAKKVS